LESKAEFSYRNYYEAKFIVALLNYLVNLVMRIKQGLPIEDGESSSETEPTLEA
jgi:AAA domain